MGYDTKQSGRNLLMLHPFFTVQMVAAQSPKLSWSCYQTTQHHIITENNFFLSSTDWLIDWLIDQLIMIGFRTSWSWCTKALINGSFVPYINLWEPCCFTKVPDGPQTYTVNVLWLQEKGARMGMSEWSQSFKLTENEGRGFFLCSTSPTQWTVWQPH